MIDSIKTKVFNILRWSERYTKTDMVYLVSGGFWLTTSQVLIAVVSLLSTVAFGLYFPKDAYGYYRYVLSVFAVLSAFTLTGLNTAIIQSVANKYEGALRQGFRLSLRWSLVASLCAIVGATYYFFKENTFLGFSLLLIAITIPLFHSYGLFGSYLNGKKDFRRYSAFSFFDNVAPLAVSIIAILFTDSVIAVLVTYFASGVLIRVLLHVWTLRVYTPQNISDPHLKEYAVKLSALNIVGIVAAHIDKILVFTSLGSVELAIYGFASAFPDRIRSLLKNLNTLMVPKFTESSNEARSIDVKGKTLRLSLLVVLITVAYWIASPYIYAIFFPLYPESVFYTQILSLSIISAVAMLPSSLFIAQKREKEIAKATIVGSVFQILILIPAVHYYGLLGVCVARVITSFIMSGVSFYLIKDTFKNA
jgi:O-antigen/teichoic acid export membrane protein